MGFCPRCGAEVERRIPDGDDRPRDVCGSCDTIHYSNPLVVTGCVIEDQGRILLCERAIEPRLGFWTVPAGFLEHGETVAEGAVRESWEEARARVRVDDIFALVDVPHVGQLHIMYRGGLTVPGYGAGPESRRVEMVAPEDIPWSEIAFPSVTYTLERYLEDRVAGSWGVHSTRVGPMV